MATKLLTRKEVADMFSVTIKTVREWEKQGKFKPACRMNSRTYYNAAEIEKLFTSKPSAHGSN
jgi:DNA-binding transcriptional MerR regulator